MLALGPWGSSACRKVSMTMVSRLARPPSDLASSGRKAFSASKALWSQGSNRRGTAAAAALSGGLGLTFGFVSAGWTLSGNGSPVSSAACDASSVAHREPSSLAVSNRVAAAGSSKKGSGEATKEKEPEARFDLGHLWTLLKEHWGLMGVAVVSALSVAALNIEIPRLLGGIVNVIAETFAASRGDVVRDDFLREIREPSLRIVKLYLAQAAATFTYIYTLSCVGERVASKMRQELFESVLRQDVAFFDEHKTGEVMARLTADVQDFKSSFKQVVSIGLRSAAQTVGSGISLYLVSPELAKLTFLVIPTVVGLGTYLGSFLRAMSRKAQEQVARATDVAEECLSNIRTVRAFAMEDSEALLYAAEQDQARKNNEQLGMGIGLFQGGVNLFLNAMVLSTLYCGGYLMADQKLTPGDLMSFLVASQTIQRSVSQLSLLFGHLLKGISAGARVQEYINLKPGIPLSGGITIPYHNLMGEIEFKKVRFSYPARPDQVVLDDLDLKIPAAHMVALVGTSGGGKTTVASLLERFYDCDQGSITLDGVPLSQLDPKWLRGRAIGYISQEPVLFATSILENIRYGNPKATDQEVYEAAVTANAHEFIARFPSGYSTVLGERGVTLSGGQKQRVAIARAILKNPSILILDEATSALDSESEKIVQEALDTACKGKTVLVIAHRLSTVRKANLVAVMSHGKVVEIGTHDQLKRANGPFSYLLKQQELSD